MNDFIYSNICNQLNFIHIFSPTLIITVSEFFSRYHLILSIIIIALGLGIFFRGNKLYSETKDSKMIIIAAGFLFGGLTYLIHSIYWHMYGMTANNVYKLTGYFYLVFIQLFFSVSILISSFYISDRPDLTKKNFRRNIFLVLMLIFGLIIVSAELYRFYFPESFSLNINRFILTNPPLLVINNALFILDALIYADIRHANGQKVLIPFILGLLFLAFGESYLLSLITSETLFLLLLHINIIIGFALIFVGLKDILDTSGIFGFRLKMVVFPALSFIFFFSVFATFNRILFNIHLPVLSQYTFLILFTGTVILQYWVSHKLYESLSNLISIIQKFTPGQKLEISPVKSQDEVSILSATINQAIERDWKYTQEIQELNNKETLVRYVTCDIRSSLDINETEKKIVNSIGEAFKADWCFISEYDDKKDRFLSVQNEYLSSPDLKSTIGFREWNRVTDITDAIKRRQSIIASDTDKYFEEHNLKNTESAKIWEEYNIRASVAIPIIYLDQLLGVLVFNYANPIDIYEHGYVELAKLLADQIGIAIYQARLYDQIKQKEERETSLRMIMETIMKSFLDINQIKQSFVTQIGKVVDAYRAFIVIYDPDKNRILPIDNYSEYRKSNDVISMIGEELNEQTYFSEVIKQRKEVIVSDIEEYYAELSEKYKLDVSKDLNLLKKYNVKSSAVFPISQNHLFGAFEVQFSEPRDYSQDELEFIKTLAVQAGISMNQAELYAESQRETQKNKLLADIVTAFRSSLDFEDIKNIVVEKIGITLKADRCFINPYDEETGVYLPVSNEYRSSYNVKSMLGYYTHKDSPEFLKWSLEGKEIIGKDTDKFIKENNLQNTGSERYIRQYNVKSGFSIPIYFSDNLLGSLVVHYSRKCAFNEDDLEFVRIIVGQLGIALHQSKLYNKLIQNAEKEALLRKTVEIIRSSLDINETKLKIVNSIGTVFKANWCLIAEYDEEIHRFLPVQNAYLSSPDLVNPLGFDQWDKMPDVTNALAKRQSIIISDVDKYLKEQNINNTESAELWEEYKVKACIIFPLTYQDEVLGALVIEYAEPTDVYKQGYVELAKVLADQIGIALYQSRLYYQIQRDAEKDRILKDILGDIKLTENVEDVYKYLTVKLANIFNVDRTFFISFPHVKYEKPCIDFEYMGYKSCKQLLDAKLHESCNSMFFEISSNETSIVVYDTQNYDIHNTELQNFFKDYCIKSILSVPLIKHNHEIKSLGSIVLCSQNLRIWSKDDISFLEAIANSSVAAIWGIIKRQEFERLRDTFILTLAHDLQVPLVGERKALEFLAKRPEIVKYQNMINETISSNKNIYDLLARLISSYNYEAGKYELNLTSNSIYSIINSAVDSLKEYANSKSMTVNLQIQENLPEFEVDRCEIFKVIHNFLENAITYTQQGGQIIIKSNMVNNAIMTCVSDNGPGIAPDIRERIFERYAMAIAIERKIGAGLGLYLSKQIVEAHKGEIWFTTELGKGTTFCFTLPTE